MNSPAFVCVAFGDNRYIQQQNRLMQSIADVYGDDVPLLFWTNTLPSSSPKFPDSLYGFKPYAVEAARQAGHTRIVFLDPACIIADRLDYYQDIVKDYGVIAVQDDNKLSPWCYDKALQHFNLQRYQISKWHLVGGSFYYFDFDLPLCQTIFEKWINAEKAGMFGSQREQASNQLHGHRSDEAIMSLALYTSGSRPLSSDTRYRCDGGIVQKDHFK